MIESGAVDTFVLNDQEILCRHHHAAVREQVGGGPSGPTATRGCRRRQRLSLESWTT